MSTTIRIAEAVPGLAPARMMAMTDGWVRTGLGRRPTLLHLLHGTEWLQACLGGFQNWKSPFYFLLMYLY